MLDKDTVLSIARLARIDLSSHELINMVWELSKIINFVEQLSEVDTADILPMTSVAGFSLIFRSDVVDDEGCRELLLSNAPDTFEKFFTVPKVIE